MKQKHINIALTVVLILCLVVFVVGWFFTRTTSRDATAEELERFSSYDVLWEDLPGAEGEATQKDRLLALCTFGQEDAQVGQSQYSAYTSETLEQYLYDCRQVDQILMAEDGVLFINYTTNSGLGVLLGYDSQGFRERSVYDSELDLLFYELDGTVTVFENFSSAAY